ncbi:hypothetical protein PYW07_015400 [Mythimna separata]|uniref:Multiple inositol polyphosphate phosphatase 1 n=1 Tax=Mythimna separata TaxID=271217 RepID=A0AAD7YZH2_MYTSE|nr:hypothetical protein PYW07_015400 [Mythimna separata]
MKLFICLPVFVTLFIKHVTSKDCYWNMECKYNYFSSKTPYENIRGDIRDSIVKTEGCEPISVWTIMRHGKKNPGTKFLQDIKGVLNFKDHIVSSYDNGNSSLCAQDVDNLREWEIATSFIDEPNEITNEGYQEMFRIGSRLKEALPEIFNGLKDEEYSFRPTFGPRGEVSAQAFIEGLGYKDLFIEQAETNASIGNPYGACKAYLNKVHSNPDTYNMSLQYMDNPEYVNMKEKIEERLGLSFPLTNKNLIAIYDLCRYTSDGITKQFSPWCAVFTEEDLKIIEYVGDLEHYYRSGYGTSQFSSIFGQIALADLYNNIEQSKKKQGKKTIIYITHSTMMDMVLVALNVFKDANPLTATHRDLSRKWRSSFLTTFGVNLIAVLNRCGQSDEKLDEYKVSFYWNERPFLDICNKGVCSWEEFEEIFKPFLNATTTDICEIDQYY